MEINTGNYASFKRFVNEIGDLKVKKSIRTIGIIGYILAGVYFIIALLFNFFILVDAFVILGLTLAIHIAKNRVCAWLLVVYGGLNFFLSLIQNGKPAGTGKVSGQGHQDRRTCGFLR